MMWTRRAGLQRLNAFTPDAIRRALEQAELSLQGSSQFQDFYVFAFRYCLTVRLLVLLSVGLRTAVSTAEESWSWLCAGTLSIADQACVVQASHKPVSTSVEEIQQPI